MSYKTDPSMVGIAARLLEKQDAEIARLKAELEAARRDNSMKGSDEPRRDAPGA